MALNRNKEYLQEQKNSVQTKENIPSPSTSCPKLNTTETFKPEVQGSNNKENILQSTPNMDHYTEVTFNQKGSPIVQVKRLKRKLVPKRLRFENMPPAYPIPFKNIPTLPVARGETGILEYTPIPGVLAAVQNLEEPSKALDSERIINPADYDKPLVTLMRNRCMNILGPQMEPTQFEDQPEEYMAVDQDILETGDQNCNVCFKKPVNTTIYQHKQLGAWALNHKIGLEPTRKKHAVAIIALSVMTQEGHLRCKQCQHFSINLKRSTAIQNQNLDHLMTHGSMYGENPEIEEVLEKQEHRKTYICVECTEIFPSLLSLLIHSAYSKSHHEKTEIFCPLCFKFYQRTDLVSHMTRIHPCALKCPMCSIGLPSIMDLMIHLVNSRPHFQLSPEVNRMLTFKQIRDLANNRSPNTLVLGRMEIMTRDILKRNNMVHLARYLNQPELIRNYRIEVKAEEAGIPNLLNLVAKYMDRENSLKLSTLMQSLKNRSDLPCRVQDIEELHYELMAINIGLIRAALMKSAERTPVNVGNLLYGEDLFDGNHLIGSSILVHRKDDITKADLGLCEAIIIGTHLLDRAGTLPSASFKVLNLSPEQPQRNTFPNSYYNTEGENNIQGARIMENELTSHVPSDRNLLQHIKEMIFKTPHHLPFFIELNLLTVLQQYSPDKWETILRKNLKSILLGFFIGIARIVREATHVKGAAPELVIMGQPPFGAQHQLDSKILISMWETINSTAILLSRFLKINYIPTTGLISYGEGFYTNILQKPYPTFVRDHSLSNYSRHQALRLVELYCKTRKQTLRTLLGK